MGRTKLSPRFKASAVALSGVIGVNEAANQVGVSRRTVYQWRKDAESDPALGAMVEEMLNDILQMIRGDVVGAQVACLRAIKQVAGIVASSPDPNPRLVSEVRLALDNLGQLQLAEAWARDTLVNPVSDSADTSTAYRESALVQEQATLLEAGDTDDEEVVAEACDDDRNPEIEP